MSKVASAGLLCAALSWVTLGCSPSGPAAPPKVGTEEGHDHEHGHEHAHDTHGPHEGELIELGGGKYHAEVVHDDATHLVTIYLLGEDTKTAAPVAEESLVVSALVDGKSHQFALPAKPLEGESDGKSSRFELADEALTTALDDAKSKARLSVTIDGRPYSGSIEAHDHAHEHK